MSIQLAAKPSRTGEFPSDVIRRVVRAWMGAYDVSQEEFAKALGMNERTFARRLSDSGPGRKFTDHEIGRIAQVMSEIHGVPISVGDVFNGHIDVSRPWRPETVGGLLSQP
jgi:uncharacterized protein (DUF2384 family)